MADSGKDKLRIQFGRTNALYLNSLFGMAPQIFLASFSIFLVSVVDGLVVGNAEGGEALAAVTAMGPFLTLVGVVVAVVHSGVSVVLPQLMGAGDRERELGGYRATFVLTLVVAACIALLQIPVAFAVIASMGFSPETAREAWAYASGLFIANPLDCISTIGSYVLISTGNAECILALSLVEGLVNLGADIILVSGFDLGTFGAGIGTALAIALRCAITLVLIKRRTRFFQFGRQSCIDPAWEMVRSGIPDGFRIGINALFSWGISWLIMDSLGVEGMAVKAAISFTSSLTSMLLSSVTKSARTIIGFRKGLNDDRGIFHCFQTTAVCVVVLTLSLTLLICLFPEVPYVLYGVQDIPAYGSFAIRVFAVSLVFDGLNVVANYYHILRERAEVASTLNFLEGLLIPAVCIVFALLVLGNEYIWICFPCSSLAVFFINVVLLGKAVPQDWEKGLEVRSLGLSVTKDQVESLCDRVRDTAHAWELSARDAYRLSLVIEEIGMYAKRSGPDSGLKTDLLITVSDGRITVAFMDNAEKIKELDEDHIKGRTSEGFSNYDVLKDISETISYQRFINTNVIVVTI